MAVEVVGGRGRGGEGVNLLTGNIIGWLKKREGDTLGHFDLLGVF